MPNNFWIAGWGVAFILAALLYSEKVTDRAAFGNAKAQQENKGRADQQPIASSNRPPAPTYNRQPPPKEYKPDCSKREDADLCTQRRMAVAAEEQGRLNIIGLVLLIATLYATAKAAIFTGHAVIATQDAATAAQTSAATANSTLKQMEITAERQLRAYVHLDHVRIEDPLGTPKIRARIKNFGQTPGYDVQFWMRGALREYPLTLPLQRGSAELSPRTELAPSGALLVTTAWEAEFSASIERRCSKQPRQSSSLAELPTRIPSGKAGSPSASSLRGAPYASALRAATWRTPQTATEAT